MNCQSKEPKLQLIKYNNKYKIQKTWTTMFMNINS